MKNVLYECKLSQEFEVKIQLEVNELEATNAPEPQKSEDVAEENEHLNSNEEEEEEDAREEEIIILQSPAEYEPETNNNDCKFYKQNLAKRALAGVF